MFKIDYKEYQFVYIYIFKLYQKIINVILMKYVNTYFMFTHMNDFNQRFD